LVLVIGINDDQNEISLLAIVKRDGKATWCGSSTNVNPCYDLWEWSRGEWVTKEIVITVRA